MHSAITSQIYSALNRGRYLSEMVRLPRAKSNIFLTSHQETASTDLLHYHETAHLSFILNGGVVDKRRRTETERFSGDFMFFHSGEEHESLYRGFPVRNLTIELESDFFETNEISETDLGLALGNGPDARFSLLRIYREVVTGDEFSSNSIEMLLLSLFSGSDSRQRTRPVWINRVAEILHDNWNSELSVSELATAANVHPKTISKQFPRYFGCTLGEYRRKIKIEKALQLVKSSNLTLAEVALECGFYDQSHFTAAFKRLTGLLPRQFQKI